MKRLQVYAMAIALAAGGAVGARAQTLAGMPFAQAGFGFFDHDDRWGSEHWEEVRRIAQDYGFRDGVQDGRNDFFSHRDFRPARNGSYKHADHGYERRFGDKGRYKDIYREAYQRGYEDGYRGHGGPFHGDRDHDR